MGVCLVMDTHFVCRGIYGKIYMLRTVAQIGYKYTRILIEKTDLRDTELIKKIYKRSGDHAEQRHNSGLKYKFRTYAIANIC